ncbi:hypothetical protein C6T59_05060 [Burkholderia multivorans]|uniref:Uncharacterized protein n=1 Tax=Burkholderia multivorans TaxID=87883 RepID=A0A228ECJ4_9BURK|nr:conserved hypothetical protein [Burkholderia multivorans CGD1]EJO57906.1 hypothetical protein BURMUCF2_2590 [Burkholderia multivorans CF2]OXH85139.1 hypothetical protein CA830_29670 [Burkholderia multivorans]OXH91091.1 hypothetical protein CA831_07995 [Burkholderia multivorans]PRD74684.1 hypothetical protein C6P74_26435 [Burkholderia multivorans]
MTSRAGERGAIAAQRGPLSGRGGETTRDGALRYNFEVFSSPARKPFRGSAGHKPCAAQIPCGVPAARVDRPFFGAPGAREPRRFQLCVRVLTHCRVGIAGPSLG